MRSIYLFFFLLFIIYLPVNSQVNNEDTKYSRKNIVKEFKNYYKTNNYSKASDVINNAFSKFTETYDDYEFLLLAFNASYQQYLQENRKFFLNNKGDTIVFFNHVLNSFKYGLRCDSLVNSTTINKKKKNKISKEVLDKIFALRLNLLSGGKFYLMKKKYDLAFSFFDLYMSSAQNRIFNKLQNEYFTINDDSISVAKLTVHSAYGCKKYREVLRYLPLAISDTTRREILLEIGSKSASISQDTLCYYSLLHQGFNEYSDNEYFRTYLIQYYHNSNKYDDAIAVIDKCIELDSLNTKYWKLKGNELLVQEKRDSAKSIFIHVVELDPYDFETASILGNIYLKEAHEFYSSNNLIIDSPDYSKNRNTLVNLYNSAQKYFEIAYKLRPTQPELWKEGLMEVYLKLNKGDELRKIESI